MTKRDNATATAAITILCPTITASVSGGGTVCVGSSAVVTVTLAGGTRTGSSPLSFTNSPAGTTTYFISSAADSNACAATPSGSATITVNPLPGTPTITPSPLNPCPNSAGNQAGGPAGAATYAWTITNGVITSATNLQTIVFTAGPSGNVGLTLRVSNASGCTAANAVNVPTLVDTTPPVITCSTDITVTASGYCPAVVNFNVSASDNCTLSSLVATPASGSAFPVGTNTVHVVATDAAGNTNACSFKVTVLPGPAPHLSVSRVGTNAILSWPVTVGCYSLQFTPALASPPSAILWTTYAGPWVTNGGSIFVTNSATSTNRFYRLAY